MNRNILSDRSLRRWLLVLLVFAAAAALLGAIGFFLSPETMSAVPERLGGALLPAVLLSVLVTLPQGAAAALVFMKKPIAGVVASAAAGVLSASMLIACVLFSWNGTAVAYLVIALLEGFLAVRYYIRGKAAQ